MENHISIHKIGEEDSEILWIQYRQKNIKDLYIGIYYGKQESRTPKEDIEKEMSSLETDILQIKEEGGDIILMGDFNIKIVQGSSRDSMLLNKVVEDCNLVVLNKTDKCQGTWTRVNTKNEKEKSVIDYIITTNEMYDNVKDMIIDEEGCYKVKGKNESDHNTIILNTEVPVKLKVKTKRKPQWNITVNTDWQKFRETLREKQETIIQKMNKTRDYYSYTIKSIENVPLIQLEK